MSISPMLENHLRVALANPVPAAELTTLLNTLSSSSVTTAEISVLHGVTAGTVTVSKVLVPDANGDLASLRDLTVRKIIVGDSANDNTITIAGAADETASRTLNIPKLGATCSLLATSASLGATNGVPAIALPLAQGRNTDGSALAAAAAAGKFGFSISLGTSLFLVGEAAQANTKTDDALFEFVLPPWYRSGANLTATVYAKLTGSGTAGTKTVQVLCYKTATDGTQGADIGPAAASAINAAGADVTFTITGTTLNPGDKVVLKLETVLQETGGTSSITAQVGSLRLS